MRKNVARRQRQVTGSTLTASKDLIAGFWLREITAQLEAISATRLTHPARGLCRPDEPLSNPRGSSTMASKQKITTFLWFDNNAQEAMEFYTSVFKNSKIGNVSRYGEAGPGPKGTVMVGSFELEGQQFTALNGGPRFKFTEAISLVINCETQEEVDYFWEKLGAGGQLQQCGWLKDKFGLSWQVVPTVLDELMRDKDPQKSKRVMEAMLQMVKLDIPRLRAAYAGR
jgi:predicted 3-demethylubiquinone-9 3-methyltransferase (glyoxalase superfamily)